MDADAIEILHALLPDTNAVALIAEFAHPLSPQHILEITPDQLDALETLYPARPYEFLSPSALLKEYDKATELRPSEMILVADYYIGCGMSMALGMWAKGIGAPVSLPEKRWAVRMMGGMNGYDAADNEREFIEVPPTEWRSRKRRRLYRFEKALEVFKDSCRKW